MNHRETFYLFIRNTKSREFPRSRKTIHEIVVHLQLLPCDGPGGLCYFEDPAVCICPRIRKFQWHMSEPKRCIAVAQALLCTDYLFRVECGEEKEEETEYNFTLKTKLELHANQG